jgi:hypothetical protein
MHKHMGYLPSPCKGPEKKGGLTRIVRELEGENTQMINWHHSQKALSWHYAYPILGRPWKIVNQ